MLINPFVLFFSTAIVLSNDQPAIVKAMARAAKVFMGSYGNRIQICDGTADDVEIQAAIDALPVTGGKLLLSVGNFLLARGTNYYGGEWGAINPTKPVWIQGAGRDKTILKVGDGIAANAIGWRMVPDVQIEDLTIDGNRTNNPSGGVDGNQNGIYNGSFGGLLPDRLILRNVKVTECPQLGIYIGANSHMPYLENIIATNCGYEGIALDQTYGATVIHPFVRRCNLLKDAARGGLTISTGVLSEFNVIVIGAKVYDNNYAGIRLKYAKQVTLISPDCQLNGATDLFAGFGMYIDYSEDIDIFAPIVSRNGFPGMIITNSSRIKVFGGIGMNNDFAGVAADTAAIETSSTHMVVEGFRAYDDQDSRSSLLTAQADLGQKVVNVVDAYKFATLNSNTWYFGQPVIISDSTPQSETNYIASIVGNVITMKNNLANTYTMAQSPIVAGRKTQRYGIWEVGAADYNTFRDNDVTGSWIVGIIKVGAHTTLKNNRGYVTENSGTATVVNTATTIVVNHGLATTPTRVMISLTNNPTNDPQVWWVDTLTTTQFTINTKVDPGATGAIFDWRAQVGEG